MILELFEALRAYLYKGRSRIAPDRLESLSQGVWQRFFFKRNCPVSWCSRVSTFWVGLVHSLLTRLPNFYEFDVTWLWMTETVTETWNNAWNKNILEHRPFFMFASLAPCRGKAIVLRPQQLVLPRQKLLRLKTTRTGTKRDKVVKIWTWRRVPGKVKQTCQRSPVA